MSTTAARLDPGSFRDPDSRVYTENGRVLRLLSGRGLADWRELASSPLLGELVSQGRLVPTVEADEGVAVSDALAAPVAGVLEHEVIPFVSYPYEWTFAMLKDAALLQLEILRRALDAGMTLKDASPYNVQWHGVRPVFVDVGSFERLREGEPWAAYRQFCMLFLYPLMLQAWKDLAFQPLLRGSLAGISPAQCRSLLSLRDFVRRGALTDVALHSRLERRYEQRNVDLGRELAGAGFRSELIVANVRRLERLVSRLQWQKTQSEWSQYAPTTSYSGEDAERKAQFVRDAVAAERPRLVWDLGCNEGRHARIAAELADYVVAMDADALVVDRLYRSLSAEGRKRILPLTVDLVDPSPGLGWRGRERRPLVERGRPDLTLCLALAHHVSISGNVPVEELLDWLRELGGVIVIEFAAPGDPMVDRLLARKREDAHADYRRDWFERCLRERFRVMSVVELASGSRVLYHARPKASG